MNDKKKIKKNLYNFQNGFKKIIILNKSNLSNMSNEIRHILYNRYVIRPDPRYSKFIYLDILNNPLINYEFLL